MEKSEKLKFLEKRISSLGETIDRYQSQINEISVEIEALKELHYHILNEVE